MDDYYHYKVVIVDEGNIFRSVFAEEMLRKQWYKTNRKLVQGGYRYVFHSQNPFPSVFSAGLWRKQPAHDNITQYEFWTQNKEKFERLAKIFGVDATALSQRKKMKVSSDLLKDATVIYAFTQDEVDELKRRFPEHEGRIKRFSELADIKEIDFIDFSSSLNLENAYRTLRNIRRVCRNRVEGVLLETRREMNLR